MANLEERYAIEEPGSRKNIDRKLQVEHRIPNKRRG